MSRDPSTPPARSRGGRPVGPLLLVLGLACGCGSEARRKEGESCSRDSPCARGLRCSFQKKRCYRPVDCKRLETRLDRCLEEIVFAFAPQARKLEPARRVKVMKKISNAVAEDLVKACRYDARAFRRKHGQEPPQKRSRGEDARASEINACLEQDACPDFARCILAAARLRGKKRPDPRRKRVLPLPRPLQPPRPDSGLSTTIVAPTTATGEMAVTREADEKRGMKPARRPDVKLKARESPRETPLKMAPPPPRIR